MAATCGHSGRWPHRQHDFMKVVLDQSCRTPTAENIQQLLEALESSPEDSPGDLTTDELAERHVTAPAAVASAAP